MQRSQPFDERAWSPARIFLAISAAYHLVLGSVGLMIDQTFPLSEGAAAQHSEHIFGIFETNGWHSVAGLSIGLVSLYFALRPRYAREASIWIGISQLGVVLAFAFFEPTQFLFASNGADQWIHSLTTVGGIAAGLMTRARSIERHLVSDATAGA